MSPILLEMDLSNYMCKMKEYDGPSSKEIISQSAAIKALQEIHTYEECSKLVLGFHWHNIFFTDPCKYAQPTLNNLGFCYSFNLLPLQIIFRNTSFYHTMPEYEHGRLEDITWSIDKGYPEDYPSQRIPWRVAGSGMENGFSIIVKTPMPNLTCQPDATEISAIFHTPNELPSFSNFIVPINVNKITLAQISPKVVNTSGILQYWAPDQRGCYFESERELLHFTSYTQKNCDIECEANRTLSLCGCSPLFHPRLVSTPLCGTKKRQCVQESLLREGNLKDKDGILCSCKPSCNEIEYTVHSSSLKWNWANYLGSFVKRISSNPEKELGGLHVTFRSKYTVAVIRNSLLTELHFIGNIGGLMGLFLGFSILSFVEIIYFLVFRPCYRLYQTFEHSAMDNTA